jgi:hypothetical protein
MNLDQLSRWLTLIANVGVIAGILFLAVEIQQNNELLASQARSDREAVRRTAFARYIENPEAVRVMVKSQRGEPLNDEEAFLLSRLHTWTLWDWANIYREVQEGLLDDDALVIDGWRTLFRQNGAAMEATWSGERSSLPDDFVQWMEEYIVNER